MFGKVLIADRGVMASRLIRTLRRLGVSTAGVYAASDRQAPFVRETDTVVLAPKGVSCLSTDIVLRTAKESGADAIHPGCGPLSADAEFVRACERAGVAFLGPTADQIQTFNSNRSARETARIAGVPLLPRTKTLLKPLEANAAAEAFGYPLRILRANDEYAVKVCRNSPELEAHIESAAMQDASFNGVVLEPFIEQARVIEVQIFGDGRGRVIAIGDRDCSIQCADQKLIVETPAPQISSALRLQILTAAQKLASAVGYRSAGTIEFLYNPAENNSFSFK